jgi:sialidase-1
MKNQIFAVLILISSFLPCNSQVSKNKSFNSSTLNAGQFSSQDLFISGDNNVNTYRIPSLITTKSGTVIALCDARVDDREDAPANIDLVIRKSFDSGKIWSKPKVIADFPGNEAAADASMVIDRETGTLWVAYDYVIPDAQGGTWGRLVRIHLIKSDDDGNTWSSPVDLSYLTKGKNFWLQNGPGVGLFTEGTIVFPMYACPGRIGFGNNKAQFKGQTMLIYSKNHGKTWLLSNGVSDLNVEPQIVALAGGKIMANMRRSEGRDRHVAITDNFGRTWYGIHNDSTLIDPGCQGSIINYNFNNKFLLVFSNAADSKERKNMVVRISYDEGKSWKKELPIYSGSVAYSCLTQLPNGNIGLLYEADDYTRIIFVEIPKEEF